MNLSSAECRKDSISALHKALDEFFGGSKLEASQKVLSSRKPGTGHALWPLCLLGACASDDHAAVQVKISHGLLRSEDFIVSSIDQSLTLGSLP